MRYDVKAEITLFDDDIKKLKELTVLKAGPVLVFYRQGEPRSKPSKDKGK